MPPTPRLAHSHSWAVSPQTASGGPCSSGALSAGLCPLRFSPQLSCPLTHTHNRAVSSQTPMESPCPLMCPQKDCVSLDHAGPVSSPHSLSEQGWVPSRSLRRPSVPSGALGHLTKVKGSVSSGQALCPHSPSGQTPRKAHIPSGALRERLCLCSPHSAAIISQSSSEPLRMSNVSSHAFRAVLYSPQIPRGPCSLRCPQSRACSPQAPSAHALRGKLCPLRHPQKIHVPSCANR